MAALPKICDFCRAKSRGPSKGDVFVQSGTAGTNRKVTICQSCIRICNYIVARRVRARKKKTKKK